MKTKVIISLTALLAILSLFYINRVLQQNSEHDEFISTVTTVRKTSRTTASNRASSPHQRGTQLERLPFQGTYEETGSGGLQTRVDNANALQMTELLAEIEIMPDSAVKEDMIRAALTRWAVLDGSAAATWARNRREYRHLLPDILSTWATTSPEQAASAWDFAKKAFASEPDAPEWRDGHFVKVAFHGMAATPTESVWNELKNLTTESAVHAMMGMADFASNAQINTAFTADMEQRVLGMNSAPLAAAFYAAAGHIQAAKDDLADVNEAGEWHIIAREIARQQAVFEPAKALGWLESQFAQPHEAIPDMVASIGCMHALNAGDVLNWLDSLPESDERSSGIGEILQQFPELHPSIPVQTIIVK